MTETPVDVAYRCDIQTMASHGEIWALTDRPALLDRAVDRIDDLVRRWTRFDPDSELSQFSAHAFRGDAMSGVAVSRDTLDWFVAAEVGWWMTGGLWDPTVRSAVEAIGYTSSLADGCRSARYADSPPPIGPAPGLGDLRIDLAAARVATPAGIALDPGAMAKGLIADRAVQTLLDGGAHGAMVDLGGDIAIGGLAERPAQIDIANPFAEPGIPAPSIGSLSVGRGGVATSTTRARRFSGQHHCIDPRTGRPAETDLVSVTVAADSCWEAEVWATAGLVGGTTEGVPLLDSRGVRAVFVTEDGVVDALNEPDFVGRRLGATVAPDDVGFVPRPPEGRRHAR